MKNTVDSEALRRCIEAIRTSDKFSIERTTPAMPRKTYQILWDNGHANGTLAESWLNRRDAERAAREWKRAMVNIESDLGTRREAQEAYQWEIIETPTE